LRRCTRCSNLAPEPLPAEEIAETLSVARSNVSTSLKELQSWGLVTIAHVLGDRRDHFVARSDTWDILLTILEQRKRREIEPTLAVLQECAAEMEKDRANAEGSEGADPTICSGSWSISRPSSTR
jgi:DNA-binding transcriptional regulator GbsR (MarR family)